MKSKWLITILVVFTILAGCSGEKDVSSTDTTTQSLEEFQGHAIAKETEDNGREKLLVVKGITQKDALNTSYKEIVKSTESENVIWFVTEKNIFDGIKKGNEVKVWWDNAKPHNEPAILTLPAEKVEVIRKSEEATSNDEVSTFTGYIQNKDSATIWVTSKPDDKKSGIIFDIKAIDQTETAALKTGQKVQVTHDADLIFSDPAQGTAVEIKVLEE
ncbi:YobA family protein [Domibacillus sp. PGB-M46]|uniref:DUF3221 domain-containing protein n=1 Tax=Domibacillus sp. PGB-M46 TaxID=2910255 RepID=UPI001F58B87E|nr:DUF3221 domain-containing protein [Domibacillus sp. PGB-M46]MCI2256431.1 YobA family protein [Domibacillus sp. PGB-M46]